MGLGHRLSKFDFKKSVSTVFPWLYICTIYTLRTQVERNAVAVHNVCAQGGDSITVCLYYSVQGEEVNLTFVVYKWTGSDLM